MKNSENKGILNALNNFAENGDYMKRFKKLNILTELRLLSLHHMIFPAITIAICFILLNLIDFDNVFRPTTYKNSFDAYLAYTNGEESVTVTIPTLKYTGYNIMKGDRVVSVYYYDLTSDKCMFYKLDMQYESVEDIPRTLTDVHISGKLVEPDGLAKNMMESFAQSISWNYESLRACSFPVIMDEKEYNPNVYYFLYILILVGIFYSLYVLATCIILFIAPYLHPAYFKIKPYYKDMSYFKMIDMINNNLDEKVLIKAGRMYITDSFFINLGIHEVSIMPLDQIVLAYNHGKLITFFGIHIKMNHTLHLRGYKNVKVLASRKKATHVTIITDYIRDNYPNIIWGHTKENIKAYKQILATEKANNK
ncbi:MAG: hypothetical protein SPF70_08065 [Lachnospiraceae bacterium]|nr:hypothetical protein [Lachnospiraceae bacterium]